MSLMVSEEVPCTSSSVCVCVCLCGGFMPINLIFYEYLYSTSLKLTPHAPYSSMCGLLIRFFILDYFISLFPVENSFVGILQAMAPFRHHTDNCSASALVSILLFPVLKLDLFHRNDSIDTLRSSIESENIRRSDSGKDLISSRQAAVVVTYLRGIHHSEVKEFHRYKECEI